MLHQGSDDHRRLRRLVSGAFTRAPIEALRSRITEIAEELLDELEATHGEPTDIREAFAFPLPVRVICEVLGVPHTAISGLRQQFDRLVIPQDSGDPDTDIRIAVTDIYNTLGKLIAFKRNAPADDLTAALIEAHDNGDRLSEQELVETLFLILIAGHETTINAITNTVHSLLTHPHALSELLRGDDEAWSRVVDEGLRFSPPIRHVVLRYATADVDVAGTRIRKGEAVLAATVAAGRDPQRHERPDEFDIHRSTSKEHIAFGYGAHYCLGARLAKLETEIALRCLFTRFPRLELAAEPAQLRSISLQGFTSLSVHLDGQKAHPALPTRAKR
ncbi:cytochrome P450 [Streptomyces sp. ISL-10]|uniref:cytochrome P450 n=1 Tax=Streptomyces sp. ISL-10 TaxID=2819172 RepID=UPI001BECD677|nr:cytochrome P450 [Streptomyces sp. ISL-10]MBT2369165.1 cytochrome P450 [Streptomyces sp. ISL-10]